MACQKGPGEGYMAAKDATLALLPANGSERLCCRVVTRIAYNGAKPDRIGFIVENQDGTTIGRGKLSRDAWSNAYFKLGGKFPIPSML